MRSAWFKSSKARSNWFKWMLNSARRIKQGVLSGANRMHALSSVKHASMFCMRYSMSTRFSQAGRRWSRPSRPSPNFQRHLWVAWLAWYCARVWYGSGVLGASRSASKESTREDTDTAVCSGPLLTTSTRSKQNQGPESESLGCRVVSKESVHAHRFTPSTASTGSMALGAGAIASLILVSSSSINSGLSSMRARTASRP